MKKKEKQLLLGNHLQFKLYYNFLSNCLLCLGGSSNSKSSGKVQLVEHWKSYCFSCIEFAVLPVQHRATCRLSCHNGAKAFLKSHFNFLLHG